MIIGIIFAYLYLLLYFRVETTGNQYESLYARRKETKDKGGGKRKKMKV